MDIMQAKLAVIEAGKKLVATGLIARTWGNVSCRVNENEFVITPSGRSYETLTPDEIVKVKIDDLSYEGDIKPSSEKGVHASAYILRPECNFVIHTHQLNASVVSAMGIDMPVESEEYAAVLGSKVPLASYGLPGTKKLKMGVYNAIQLNAGSKAVIMSHHGAVCMGADIDDAFAVAQTLEDACNAYIVKKFKAPAKYQKPVCYNSVRAGEGFVLSGDDGFESECPMSGAYKNQNLEAEVVHRDIYAARSDVNAIVQSAAPTILDAAHRCGKKLRPLLDDYAQIAGATVRMAKDNKVVKALKGRSAAFMKDGSVLCCGPDVDDANAIQMVVEKNCKAFLAGEAFEKTNYIGKFDSVLMRVVYKMKYSKQKNK